MEKDRALWVGLHLGVLEELGRPLREGASVLDLGCGSGDLVSAYRERGFEASGAEFEDRLPAGRPQWLKPLQSSPYRLPFADKSFDFVFSEQVLEHVADYDAVLGEVARVLKKDGVSFHSFPSRWRPVEPHAYVPLAGVLRGPAWLGFWARLGVRNPHQKGRGWKEVAAENETYLKTRTNYLSGTELAAAAGRRFERVRFVEDAFIRKAFGRARWLAPLVGVAPPLARVFAAIHTRALYLEGPKNG